MSWREFDLIQGFCGIPLDDPSVLVGPGDDCAVLAIGGVSIVITTDLIQDGVDFILGEADPFDIGWKAVMISASDVASMGAAPTHFVVASSLPPDADEYLLSSLWNGMYAAAGAVGASIVGGDLSKGAPLTLVSTGLGALCGAQPVLRSGARAGDSIYLTGPVGGSILGHHLRFAARCDFAKLLGAAGLATAMIDISDGLSGDLCHIADASKLDFAVKADLIPVSTAAVELSGRTGRPPLWHALNDGEDFELIFTVAPDREPDLVALCTERGLRPIRIGQMLPAGAGRVLRNADGDRPWVVGSYEHS